MWRKEFYRRTISGIMLIAFFAATIIFQNISLKNYYSVKIQKEDAIAQSFTGQLGLLEEENQTTPTNTLQKEEDDFKSEYTFLASQHYELLTLQYLVLQEHVFSEHHPEIVSPPPQA